MKIMDQEGTWRGTVAEAAVSQTKKGFPQYVVRLDATQKYVDSSTEMEHYGLTEPGWVDVSDWGESITGYLVLCNEDKKLLNYEQVMKAFGWDGKSFSGLNGLNVEGREVLFRTENNEYEGNTRLQVNWVDDKDAPVNRELQRLDDAKLSDLDAKFKGLIGGGDTPPAKPAAAKPKAGKAASKPEETAPESAAKPGKAKAKAGKAPPTASKPPKASAPPLSEDDIPFDAGTLFESVPETPADAQVAVWEAVNSVKGETADSEVGNAWIEACREVGGDRSEDTFTRTDWIAIGNHVIAELGLTV